MSNIVKYSLVAVLSLGLLPNTSFAQDSSADDEDVEETEPERVTTIENLEKMLEHAVANEEYEIAASVRDRIEQMKAKATE